MGRKQPSIHSEHEATWPRFPLGSQTNSPALPTSSMAPKACSSPSPPKTHEMLTLHFSQVWSLGGVAEALEVGKEAWGLSELGTKAGVPPGRGRRQTDA